MHLETCFSFDAQEFRCWQRNFLPFVCASGVKETGGIRAHTCTIVASSFYHEIEMAPAAGMQRGMVSSF